MSRYSFQDAAGFLVRKLVRTVCGMPENSIRKAGLVYPAGQEGSEYGTVKILTTTGKRPISVLTDSATTGVLTETIYQDSLIVASVQFFRHASPGLDGAGISRQGSKAFARASTLGLLLQARSSIALMESMGLGFRSASQARDLSELAGPTYEDRGSVDLTFTIMNAETFTVASVATAVLDIKFQTVGGDLQETTLEVTHEQPVNEKIG